MFFIPITLNQQMNIIYENGLTMILGYQDQVLNEWRNILIQLRVNGKRSAKNVEETIHFFSNELFYINNKTDQFKKNDPQISILKPRLPFQTNKFVITLLENAVHKVIQDQVINYHKLHYQIHYLFLKISEEIMALPYDSYFSIDNYFEDLVHSRQLPIEWMALCSNKNGPYSVDKWFNNLKQDFLLEGRKIEANTIYSLTELLLESKSDNDNHANNVFPIPYEDKTLLVCIYSEDAEKIVPFITYALQTFKTGNEMLEKTKYNHDWKDAVIMFNESIIQSNSYNEVIENITEGLVKYLPFERCALFSYSKNAEKGFGLFGHGFDNEAIQNIAENISNLPIIQNNLNGLRLFETYLSYIQPIYIEDAALGFPAHYINQFQLQSLVVVPIYTSSNNQLIGAAILDQGPSKLFKVSEETFTALVKMGKISGEILTKYYHDEHDEDKSGVPHLSPREMEVLELMAEGTSTNEAARHLNLSEYTVRDYISSIMQKMDARNRTEAVAIAIRLNLIK